jgi:histone H3/H4
MYMEFSARSIHRLIKNEGEKRVSEDAANELRDILEGFAEEVADEAVRQADLDDKKTVQQGHVEQALNSFR